MNIYLSFFGGKLSLAHGKILPATSFSASFYEGNILLLFLNVNSENRIERPPLNLSREETRVAKSFVNDFLSGQIVTLSSN